MDTQRTEIIGHLSQGVDNGVKFLPSGQPVAEFAIASNHRYKAADGTPKEDVLFMDCKLFGKRAEKLAPYLVKGKHLRVVGRLRQNRWEKDGVKHSRMELIVNEVLFLSPKETKEAIANADLASAEA